MDAQACPVIEPLEQRILLSTSLTEGQTIQILDGLSALQETAAYFDTAGDLAQSISILGEGMGTAFGADALVSQDIIGASQSYFNGNSSWTLEGWAEYVRTNA